MSDTLSESAAWYRALTLTERLALLRASARTMPTPAMNTELARKRLQRWREQPPFSSDAIFAQRLEMDGIAEADLSALLGEPADTLGDPTSAPAPWIEEIDEAFALSAADEMAAIPEPLHGQPTAGFLQMVTPLLKRGCEQVRAGVRVLAQEYHSLPFDPYTIPDLLFAHLPTRLLRLLSRTLVLELNIARLEGQLPGDSSEQRFQSFVRQLAHPGIALGMLEQYPVLARQLVVTIDTWAKVSLEFLRHLCQDWPAIRERFSPSDDPGLLGKVDFGAGDMHKGGRTVAIVTFASGLRLVYKPRALAVETHFQELLRWLNQRGAQPTFRIMNILDRDDHGWVEFIAAHGCATPDEVERFYRRQGAYLALLYALEATDFHDENLIAAGEHPVLIDLESLFHPRAGGKDLSATEDRINQAMSYSVLRVLLLPMRVFGDGEAEGIDISGLGGAGGQLSAKAMPDLEAAGTDEMHFVRRRRHLPGRPNRPNLNGATADPLEYTESLVAGFEDMYHLLLRHRAALLAGDGPIARFAGDEIRVLFRSTRMYGLLLFESFHPYLLRNALDRDRHFDRLWLGVEARPYLARVVSSERADLLRGDIPMFTTRPETRDVWSGDGERIAGLLDEAGLALVHRRLQGLSETDLDQQVWFIRASMATLAPDIDQPQRRASLAQRPSPMWEASAAQRTGDAGGEGDLDQRLIAAARKVGDRLDGLAYRGEEGVAWLGLGMTASLHWALAPAGMDLYAGLPGLALFLAYLGDLTGQPHYTVLAMDALESLRREIERSRTEIKAIGAFTGWGGVIYTLTHLATLWKRRELLAEAEEIVAMLPPLIEADKSLDIIGGAAGCIGALLALYRAAPSAQTLRVARACGERLLAQAQALPGSSPDEAQPVFAWLAPPATTPLTGFSHGAAGIAWALLELAAITGEARFRAAALGGIAYERALFSPEVGNWPDLRSVDSTSDPAKTERPISFRTSWCHGAPGIGLSRLLMFPHLETSGARAEIEVALRTTLREGFGGNHSLCHGDLGNLETLLLAAHTLADPVWQSQTNRLAAAVLDSIEREGWQCGDSLRVEAPGLMTGLAGIGYQLLRLAAPERVPSALALEAPRL